MRRIIASIIFFAAASCLWCVQPRAGEDGGTGPESKEPEKVMYVFAHQDDEALIVAKMALDVHEGREVHAVWITDGAGTANPDVREAESREVMKRVGVPQEQLYFLRYPDRYSWKHLEEALAGVMEIAKKVEPSKITSNAYEGGNIDHDVVSLISSIVARRLGPGTIHYEFPLYNTYKGTYRLGIFLPYPGAKETLYTRLNKKLYVLKKRIPELYVSQAAIVSMLDAVLDKEALKKYGEPYRVSPDYDYTKKPVDEMLGYEISPRNPVTFDDWKTDVVPFLEKVEKGKI